MNQEQPNKEVLWEQYEQASKEADALRMAYNEKLAQIRQLLDAFNQSETKATRPERIVVNADEAPQKKNLGRFVEWLSTVDIKDWTPIKSAALGAVGGAGGYYGLIEHPARFLNNLDINLALATLTIMLTKWLAYKEETKERQD